MNKATVIKQVNELVQVGQTGEAINILLDFLDEHQQQQPELYDEVIQLKAIFKRAKRQVAMNIISEEHATQELEELNDTIEDIVRKINRAFKAKEKRQTPVPPAATNNKLLYGGVGALGLSLVAIMAFTILNKGEMASPAYCPDFDSQASWNTLIIPYQYATNKNEIKERLDSVSAAVSFNASCRIADIDFNDAAYPNTLQKAKAIGKGCNTDLIFWKNISESINKVRYHFVDLGDSFQFNVLSPGQGNFIDSIVVETSIPTNNELSASENETIYPLLLGIGASRAGEHLMAIRILDAIPDSVTLSTDFTLLKQLHLADSYRLLDRKERAIDAYSKILDNYDGYTLASLNRGVLYWSLRNYKNAINDFNTVLAADSTHVIALYARGRACVDMGMIDQAESALLKAEGLIGTNSSDGLISFKKEVIASSLRDIKKRKSEIRESIRLDSASIRKTKDNPKLNNELARHYLQIGETHNAIGLLYSLGPGELERETKKIIRNRLIAQADKNFQADLEALLLDDD